MLMIAFTQWWMTAGWSRQIQRAVHFPGHVFESFDVAMLIKTLFKPWKRIISVSRPDQALGDKFRNFLDNLISRFVGFFVRFFVLIGVLLWVALGLSLQLVFTVVWPLLPFAPIALIMYGVMQ